MGKEEKNLKLNKIILSSTIIYIIAFLEGFTTLSVEIVSLRLFTPIIGSNSISTSIVLGVILIALSYGYYISYIQ